MSSHHVEIERKYESTCSGAELAELRWNTLDELIAQKPIEEHLQAVYFDTPDRLLGKQKIAVRRRIGGYDQGWHIKFDDDKNDRHELHYPLLEDREKMPEAAREFVASAVGRQQIEAAVEISTLRLRTVLKDAKGVGIAEICDDTVQSYDVATGIRRSWHEWEVEILEPGVQQAEQIFEECERVLYAAGVQRSQSVAKIARALGQDDVFEARRAGNNLAG